MTGCRKQYKEPRDIENWRYKIIKSIKRGWKMRNKYKRVKISKNSKR